MGKRRQKEIGQYLYRLRTMTDEEFHAECKNQMWLSAYAHNNPNAPAHWRVDACCDFDVEFAGGSRYQAAYDELHSELFGQERGQE